MGLLHFWPAQNSGKIMLFLAEVERVEKDPEKMTGEEHIARMFRPGSKYFNMNPFEVLGLDWEASAEDVKKALA